MGVQISAVHLAHVPDGLHVYEQGATWMLFGSGAGHPHEPVAAHVPPTHSVLLVQSASFLVHPALFTLHVLWVQAWV